MKLRDDGFDENGERNGWIRKGKVFDVGDKRVILSVQASEHHYSTPKVNGIRLCDCISVEIALVNDKYVHGNSEPYFYLPSELGIQGYDNYFSFGRIGAYVPLDVVERLADELAENGTMVAD